MPMTLREYHTAPAEKKSCAASGTALFSYSPAMGMACFFNFLSAFPSI